MNEKKLSNEDSILWDRIKKSIKKKEKQSASLIKKNFLSQKKEEKSEIKITHHFSLQKQETYPPPKTRQINKKLRPSTRIDLHGLNQNKAYALLLSLLPLAYEKNFRNVLIITGKGSTFGEGVFKRLVPLWLESETFKPFVASFSEAERRSGGCGAINLKIRKKQRESKKIKKDIFLK